MNQHVPPARMGRLAAAAVPLGRHPRAGLLVHGGCLIAALGFAGIALAALLVGALLEWAAGRRRGGRMAHAGEC